LFYLLHKLLVILFVKEIVLKETNMCDALRSNERKAHRFYKNIPSLPFITVSKENKDSEGYWG